MNQKSGTSKDAADKLVRGIKRKTGKNYSAEEKIRFVLAGLRGEESIAALCRREGIAESLYYPGRRSFSTPASSVSPVIRRARQRSGGEGAAIRGGRAQGGRCRTGSGEPVAQKNHARGWGGRRMRHPASAKLEIIRTAEASHLPVRQTLAMLGIPSSTYCQWYARWLPMVCPAGSMAALTRLRIARHARGRCGTASRMTSVRPSSSSRRTTRI